MYQVFQSAGSGELEVGQVPGPAVRPGYVLIANECSLISAGTERMVVELSRKSLLGKARERPDLVLKVLKKVLTEGFSTTASQVKEKLSEPISLGYSSTGIVLACGQGVQEFKPGDRVASNGPHAEIVCVPRHLCARVPAGVASEHAAFTVVASIALQGVRLTEAGLGDVVFVIGLGLIGHIAVSLLSAAGCRVIGTDLDAAKCEHALRMGAEVARPGLDPRALAELTAGLGADAVLITAASKSSAPIDLAGEAVRKKGRVVLVGVANIELPRQTWYEKEAEFVVSCSYGPGRYDPAYEDRGHDYPAPYVRWTEQRNMQAVLNLMAGKRLDVSSLITHRFPIERAGEAYDIIEKSTEPYLGIVLGYPDAAQDIPRAPVEIRAEKRSSGQVGIGCIGAGQFGRMVLLPIIGADARFALRAICSAGGTSASRTAEKLGFAVATSDEDQVLADASVDAVFILTRHDLHAAQILKALRAGKHVYVEKPLALNEDDVWRIEAAMAEAGRLLTVGFNRRFSPAAVAVRQFFSDCKAPLTVSIRFNGGEIPAEHWTQQDEVGGGRIIGEACHAIDLATFLVGSPPVRVFAESIGGDRAPTVTDDQCFITLRHADGSISNVGYLSGGDSGLAKERVEVLGGGRMAVIDDFKEVVTSRGGRATTVKARAQDKGHRAEIEAFAGALVEGRSSPISWQDVRSVSLAAIYAVRSLREGVPFVIPLAPP